MRGGNTDQTDPFERLEQTHRRLGERLDQLIAATDDLGRGIEVSSAIADLEQVAGFLSRGAVRHVEDEERSLFPRLRSFPELALVLAALTQEHAEHQELEAEVIAIVGAWQGGTPAAADVARLDVLGRRLREVYAAHIIREEEELFPQARNLLAPAVIEEMGREMMARRPDRGKDQR